MGLPYLIGPGLTLREPDLSDAGPLAALISADSSWRFTARAPADASDFAAFIAWAQAERLAGKRLCYGLVPDGEAHAVGLIMIRRLELDFQIAECGFVLGTPCWPTGLLVTGVTLATDFVLREVGVHRLELRTLTVHEDDVLRRLGAVHEGVLRGSWRTQDGLADQNLWSILDPEWRAADRTPHYRCEAAPVRAPECAAAAVTDERHLRAPAPWSDTLPVLYGAGATLREIEPGDAPVLLAAIAPADIETSIQPPPTTVGLFDQFIGWAREQRRLGRAACFVIVPTGASAAAGIIQIRQLDPQFTTADWGIVLSKACRGTGLFAEVARMIFAFAFEKVGVRRLEARTSCTNLPASGAMRKVGATRDARLRSAFLRNGQYLDDDLWAILDDDWQRTDSLPPGSGSRSSPAAA
jgi:RimJ/RimL family protein N-acetyltransferase